MTFFAIVKESQTSYLLPSEAYLRAEKLKAASLLLSNHGFSIALGFCSPNSRCFRPLTFVTARSITAHKFGPEEPQQQLFSSHQNVAHHHPLHCCSRRCHSPCCGRPQLGHHSGCGISTNQLRRGSRGQRGGVPVHLRRNPWSNKDIDQHSIPRRLHHSCRCIFDRGTRYCNSRYLHCRRRYR